VAEGELEVEILREREVVTYPRVGERATTVAITFRHGDLPPMTVWIPRGKDTPEARAAAIRAEIQRWTVGGRIRMRV